MEKRRKEFKKEKSKSCLVIIDSDFKMEMMSVLKERIGSLLRKNYKFFYFIYDNTVAKEIHTLFKKIKSNAKCLYPHFYRQLVFNVKHFDVHYPLDLPEVDERISWAEKSCEAVLTTKSNKYGFKNKQVYVF